MPASAERAKGPDQTPPRPTPHPATHPASPPADRGQIRAVPGQGHPTPPGSSRPQTIREREIEARRRKMRARSVAADFHAQRLRQDRWGWRRKIRRDSRKLAFYRAIIGVLGTMFICLGIITGPLPGPGGIPLVLLGLAIWASEFHWAHRVMVGFKARLKQYMGWTLRQKVTFWLVFAGCCWVLVYAYLLAFGPPTWMPVFVQHAAALLPGV